MTRTVDYGDFVLHHGNCLDVLRDLPDASVDSVVTDPPYGLSFMGKKWDYDVPSEAIWREALRVLKPGGHLLAFAGTRTQHRMAVRIEDAGFEIRDMLAWVYGSGFPKSLDVSKALDARAGAEREVIGFDQAKAAQQTGKSGTHALGDFAGSSGAITAPATDAARQWAGWGTALKPALEPITLARKPLIGTVAANVLAHGTGGLNVDGCRVGSGVPRPWREPAAPMSGDGSQVYGAFALEGSRATEDTTIGRWPANLLHDGSDEVVGAFPVAPGQLADLKGHDRDRQSPNGVFGAMAPARDHVARLDAGSAARFFYCAKAGRKDRNEGLDGMPTQQYSHDGRETPIDNAYQRNASVSANPHPTVKPVDLMRYLCRLVTPPGGVVLDPFMGSGSTGKGAVLEGFKFIGIDRDDWLDVAARRIATAKWGPWVFGGAA